MKKVILIALSMLLLISFTGCSSAFERDEKTFSQDGIEITLTKGFKQKEVSGYTLCFDSSEAAVFVLKEPFSKKAELGNMSIEEYAETVREANISRNPGEVTKLDGLTTMEYSFYNEDSKITYKYFSVMLKGSDSFYLVLFAANEDAYDNAKIHFIDYAKSIKVK